MNDACPRCLRRDNQPIAADLRTVGDLEPVDGSTQRYRCPCGHAWTTTWGPNVEAGQESGSYDPPDDPIDDPEAQPGYWDRVDAQWDPRQGW